MRIAFALYPQILATGISVPVEMFNAASQTRGRFNKRPIEVCCVSDARGPVVLTGGLSMNAESTFDDQDSFDWVFVPPMWGSPWSVIQQQSGLHDWLWRNVQQGAKIVATGTGVGHLCEAGMLSNRVATTHWYYLERFQHRYPLVKFQRQHFITHQDGIYCAGSINAQTDLVLYFIETYWGEESLALVEQQFMHELKRSFTAPFYEPGGAVHDDELVSLAQSWMRNNLSQVIELQQVARLVDQSERQFRRRFKRATGFSPLQYLNRIRLEQAQALLRETNLSVAEIGEQCGYNSQAYFAKQFRDHAHMSPSQYRAIVRSKRFQP